MLILITYDVRTDTSSGRKRLRQIAKACQDKGQRVQNSVFECLLNNAELVGLKNRLIEIMDQKQDNLRFYYLGSKYQTRIESYGIQQRYSPEDTLII